MTQSMQPVNGAKYNSKAVRLAARMTRDIQLGVGHRHGMLLPETDRKSVV